MAHKTYSESDVLGWKISRVVEEAKVLGLEVDDLTKLREEEVSGPALIMLIDNGTLHTVVSSNGADMLKSIFPDRLSRKELEEANAALKKQLEAFSYIDVWGARTHSNKSSNARTEAENDGFRNGVSAYYELEEQHCMITGLATKLKAAHIWPAAQRNHPSLANLRLTETDVDSPRNGLLLLAGIEEAFDTKDICFIYNVFNESESFPGKLMLRVLNPALKDKEIKGSVVTDGNNIGALEFGDIDGKILGLPDGKFPFRRLLNTHARAAYRNALLANWISRETLEAFEDYAHLSDRATDGAVELDKDSLVSASECSIINDPSAKAHTNIEEAQIVV